MWVYQGFGDQRCLRGGKGTSWSNEMQSRLTAISWIYLSVGLCFRSHFVWSWRLRHAQSRTWWAQFLCSVISSELFIDWSFYGTWCVTKRALISAKFQLQCMVRHGFEMYNCDIKVCVYLWQHCIHIIHSKEWICTH
jgi:hypothetical protein